MAKAIRETPERHGKKWEDDETAYILNRVQRGANYIVIAGEVKRTPSSVGQQIKKIACRMVDEGKTKEEVSEITRLAINDIDDALRMRELSNEMRQIRESRPVPPPPPKAIHPFFLARPDDKKETEIELLTQIRDLLQQLVNKP